MDGGEGKRSDLGRHQTLTGSDREQHKSQDNMRQSEGSQHSASQLLPYMFAGRTGNRSLPFRSTDLGPVHSEGDNWEQGGKSFGAEAMGQRLKEGKRPGRRTKRRGP